VVDVVRAPVVLPGQRRILIFVGCECLDIGPHLDHTFGSAAVPEQGTGVPAHRYCRREPIHKVAEPSARGSEDDERPPERNELAQARSMPGSGPGGLLPCDRRGSRRSEVHLLDLSRTRGMPRACSRGPRARRDLGWGDRKGAAPDSAPTSQDRLTSRFGLSRRWTCRPPIRSARFRSSTRGSG
jgi:hypothetical protein